MTNGSSKPPALELPASSSRVTVPGGNAPGPLQFANVAPAVGLRFHHESPLTDLRHVHLFLGSGIGWMDFDHDGWPDLYCCQGAAYATDGANHPTLSEGLARNQLFMNQAGQAFSDVTHVASGLLNTNYSMGMAAADFDNDGFVDLCVTGYGENFLYRNQGDGCFTRVHFPLEKQRGRLSAGCVWSDMDADGNLDLYISNYARLDPEHYPTCQHTAGGITIPISCHPANFEAMPDLLYRNTGNGEFEEVSVAAGIVPAKPRAGLGVIAADLDADGDMDFYVANDTTENYLWENQGDGRFVDRGDESGTSRNRHGATEAGMGVVAGDLASTGRIDLFVTNYYGESNALYRNDGELRFTDVRDELGLGAPSRLRLGFGTSLADFDNDGWLDLVVANGHVQDRLPEIHRDEPFAQLPLLFHNHAGRRFNEVSSGAGEYFRTSHVARSSAVADYDRDGDPDLALNCLNDDAALLRNSSGAQGKWLQVELIGLESNRGGIGATLQFHLGDRAVVRCMHAGSGYLSNDEAVMLIGVGPIDEVRDLSVVWPGGRRETWDSVPANRPWRLIEGTGNNSDSAL